MLKKDFGVGVIPLDYKSDPEAARQKINLWVEEKKARILPAGKISRDAMRVQQDTSVLFG